VHLQYPLYPATPGNTIPLKCPSSARSVPPRYPRVTPAGDFREPLRHAVRRVLVRHRPVRPIESHAHTHTRPFAHALSHTQTHKHTHVRMHKHTHAQTHRHSRRQPALGRPPHGLCSGRHAHAFPHLRRDWGPPRSASAQTGLTPRNVCAGTCRKGTSGCTCATTRCATSCGATR
jgi:hypothetical protein